MSKNIVMLGLPGVGKGTNAEVLSQDFNLPHISTGDIFRAAMSNHTDLGDKAKSFIDAGNLVPDDVTNGIVNQRLNEADVLSASGFILDGYPRNPEQADSLEAFLEKRNQKVDAVIYLQASQGLVTERMLARGRADDLPEVIAHRIEVAKSETMPLVEYYRRKDNLFVVEAAGEVKDVYAKVKEVISNL
ncbi:adenylate kinase [Oenococcus kitaharae]|uniref:Adenylate kinase n=1 Tax=Oenococcus kitaharae DSM 17330 TaxID=1045004 RepID=G9WFJ7_9LACO|nr:adenylate kinase [Oenococcus kitaharae]EHN59154.1 Adenylate kinase [Oenococcus kitaharae DSM 17330]OEY81969.1 adenylate kinase [Oenococcus kitaharae]OEY82340.1 adenylate kinase [Oenococcus kitaharae]OEY82746.1 adenylate kinase [Oenococcus kitaharae]